ncbi:uncharacterized protein BJ171DRAFT_475796 [Polychytrium aggregatum]|uniref:uncharacterized protein n=1 Tax=Polychytrium aggregatum TaxID=110093 RepID=UPI0022FE0E54|nr:uncharacterized protein BJ171DRAFT_475796 [Polychytrium aggregatum]KAI9203437.1 hypothetical protein BJ171DRAFT_475796 [Polychytrium aggregatum]
MSNTNPSEAIPIPDSQSGLVPPASSASKLSTSAPSSSALANYLQSQGSRRPSLRTLPESDTFPSVTPTSSASSGGGPPRHHFANFVKEKAGQVVKQSSVWSSKAAERAAERTAEFSAIAKEYSSNIGAIAKETYSVAKQSHIASALAKMKEFDFKHRDHSINNGASVLQAIFGERLELVVEVSRPSPSVFLPTVVYRCIEFVEQYGLEEEGIYRVPGSSLNINKLKSVFEQQPDAQLPSSSNPSDVASLLKLYLRSLPEPVLTKQLHPEFSQIFMNTSAREGDDVSDMQEVVQRVRKLSARLPIENYTLLHYIGRHLDRVQKKCAINKMTISNLQLIFSPALNINSALLKIFALNWETLLPMPYESYAAATPSSPISLNPSISSETLRSVDIIFDSPLQTTPTTASPIRAVPSSSNIAVPTAGAAGTAGAVCAANAANAASTVNSAGKPAPAPPPSRSGRAPGTPTIPTPAIPTRTAASNWTSPSMGFLPPPTDGRATATGGSASSSENVLEDGAIPVDLANPLLPAQNGSAQRQLDSGLSKRSQVSLRHSPSVSGRTAPIIGNVVVRPATGTADTGSAVTQRGRREISADDQVVMDHILALESQENEDDSIVDEVLDSFGMTPFIPTRKQSATAAVIGLSTAPVPSASTPTSPVSSTTFVIPVRNESHNLM